MRYLFSIIQLFYICRNGNIVKLNRTRQVRSEELSNAVLFTSIFTIFTSLFTIYHNFFLLFLFLKYIHIVKIFKNKMLHKDVKWKVRFYQLIVLLLVIDSFKCTCTKTYLYTYILKMSRNHTIQVFFVFRFLFNTMS